MKECHPPEEMSSFFDQRAGGYDAHMHHSLVDAQVYYQKLAEPITPTKEHLEILDVGCGTGLEIAPILDAAPNAHLTCIDLSSEMLNRLKEKFPRVSLNVIQASYLEFDFGRERFDIVISSMTLHHLPPEGKGHLYEKIYRALRLETFYIEGDYVVSEERMEHLLKSFQTLPPELKQGSHHIDIPLSLGRQFELLQNAGFIDLKVIYSRGENVIIQAKKGGEGGIHADL